MKLSADQAAEAVYALLRAEPELLTRDRLTPEALLHEAAAQQALLDWCQDRVSDLSTLPSPVRQLMSAFLANFVIRLTADPSLRSEHWEVPRGLSLPSRAKHVIAHEIRRNLPPHPATH